MLDCWNEDPNNRPTFGRLHEIITGLLQEKVSNVPYFTDFTLLIAAYSFIFLQIERSIDSSFLRRKPCLTMCNKKANVNIFLYVAENQQKHDH